MAEFGYVLRQNYKCSFDTLKNTSYDKENDHYMCQSHKEVIDFDHLTREICTKEHPSSYDSLLVEENEKKVFCVEFKNQNSSAVDRKKLHKKITDSHETIKKICSTNNINKDNYEFILCVVYKSDSQQHRYHRFKENEVHFGLMKFKGDYLNKIVTNDIEFFKKEFDKKYGC